MRDDDPTTGPTTDPLARPLRDAADALPPAFSPAVHAAVMRRVRLAVPPPAAGWPVARWAAAAAVLAAVGLGLWVARPRPPRPTALHTATVPSMPRWSPVALAAWPADAGYAGLDRDAGRAARFLIGQLAAVPPAAARPPASRPAGGPRLGA